MHTTQCSCMYVQNSTHIILSDNEILQEKTVYRDNIFLIHFQG